MDYDNANLQSWHCAELAARAAECEVRALLFRRTMGARVEGLEALMAAANELRQAAHRHLGLALKDIEAAAQALHHRNTNTPTIRPLGWPAPSPRQSSWTAAPARPRPTAQVAVPPLSPGNEAAPAPITVARL